ncbi:hypothetical protein [Alkalihalobacterium chitinilyticum]|uniref:Phage protein n=1 Tax=Alkalihalobacterium chitinilyticum TaxID=2980103 RepID=A0ABT5VGA3_9BACI|nr:hypothetical protein [Alkalihalobacterium chitinilyticum]MDE5414315.1 hypothetical protein [Alkalihalobacterium chitinilyticum]
MNNFSNKIDIGELIAVSDFFGLNTYRMLTFLDDGVMEVFETKEAFTEKYGNDEEAAEKIEWVELNNGKIFTKPKGELE